MEAIEKELKAGIKRAVEKLNNKELRAFKIETPVDVEIRFLNSAYAEVADLLPGVERIDGKTIRFTANTVEDAYKIMEVLTLAAAGVSYIVSR